MLFNWFKRLAPAKRLTYRSAKIPLRLEMLEDRWCPSTLAPPHITTNPANATAVAGHMVTFTAAATGNPVPAVEWEVSTDGGKHFHDLPGAKSATLSFVATAGENGEEFEAVFTSKSGKATTSAATLTVDYAPVITHQPSGHRVAVGGQVTLTAAATSNPAATVQWQVSSDGGKTFSNVPGATSTTLTFTASSPGVEKYRAIFTNAVGSADTRTVTVRVHAAPAITTSPASVSAVSGQSVTFTASASGWPTPRVEWEVSTDGGKHFHDIAGATSGTLTLVATAGMNGNQYRAVFANRFGKATTSAATLTVAVGSAPVITTQPSSQNVTTGTPVTLTAAATGVPAATVKWQWSSDNGKTFTDVPGATSPTLTFSPLVPGTFEYQAVFTNSFGSATTTAAVVTVTGK
ncbi:MAG TPA: immunoglobulin domain-containing protein, partial [Gemmataceae bacterium]|nr:immunoglobulin domain-containing protein [Gemmataceae bacterium]